MTKRRRAAELSPAALVAALAGSRPVSERELERRFRASVGVGCRVCGRRTGVEGEFCSRCRRDFNPTPLDQVLMAIGWTIREFAELSGIPERTVRRAQRGLRVSRRSAEKLAKVTGLPAETFRPDAPGGTDAASPADASSPAPDDASTRGARGATRRRGSRRDG